MSRPGAIRTRDIPLLGGPHDGDNERVPPRRALSMSIVRYFNRTYHRYDLQQRRDGPAYVHVGSRR